MNGQAIRDWKAAARLWNQPERSKAELIEYIDYYNNRRIKAR